MQEQGSGAGEVELGVPMAESALLVAGTECLNASQTSISKRTKD
jgi:hypothetical protein